MKDEDIYKQLSNYKKILEDKGYNVIYIGLYGSQNYNLDDEESDIDAKVIILPTLHDIIFRKVTSKTIECEGGNIDVKDLVTFYDVIKKGNFSYIESIETQYFIGDKYIKELFFENYDVNYKSILGAMYEKRKALTHEYPSKKKEFEKWGYDPKQYHHICRLYDLLIYNINNGFKHSYLTYDIDSKMRHKLISKKRNKDNLSKEWVEYDSNNIIEDAKKLIPENYEYKVINIDEEISAYIENKLKVQLRNNDVSYAREVRTFDNEISKKDLEKFKILEKYRGKDISYIVTESIEIL